MGSNPGSGASDRPAAVELDGVTKRYGELTAVNDVDLAVREGEFFTLVGPSGCGKTTTLRLIAGFEQPSSGAVRFGGTDVSGVPPEDRNVGVVFQNYALFPHMSVGENVAYGLQFSDPPGGVSDEERVRELLELVDLPGIADRDPESLSGGQKQRVAMARALAPGPDVLLLDEPMSALDARLRERLRVQIRSIQRSLEITTVYVTHDQEEALAISDRVAVLHDGSHEQVAPPRTVYRRPDSRFVAEFVGDNNVFVGRVTEIHSDRSCGSSGEYDSSGDSRSTRETDSSGDSPSTGGHTSSGDVGSGGTPSPRDPDGADGAEDGTQSGSNRHRITSPVETSRDTGDEDDRSRIASVDVGDRAFHVAVGDDVEPGERVTFCVRPERVALGVDVNAVRATVESAEFLGASTRVHLEWNGRELLLRTTDPVSGEVAVGFDPHDARLIDIEP